MPTPALLEPSTRVSRIGTPLRKPAGGPTSLSKRHLALIEFMVHGLPTPFPRHPAIEPHVPLGVNQAADCAGVRRKAARDLLNWPIFISAYERELAARRRGEHARSLDTIIAVRDDKGAGKAADRKVQLGAALAIMGEAGNAAGTSVIVNTAIGIQQVAGVVIDLRDDEDEPAIEGEAA